MKPSKMLELVENLKVGEKVVIEKFKDHLFVEKKYSESSENINKHGVDLSILNDKDWFYVETSLFKYLFKGDMLNENRRNLTYSHHRGSLGTTGRALCDKDDIALLRKATPEDLAPFFEKYPMYAPVEVGDIGLFYDTVGYESKAIKEDSTLLIGKLEKIVERGYDIEGWGNYKNFFKVSENETIAEIKKRFLKEN